MTDISKFKALIKTTLPSNQATTTPLNQDRREALNRATKDQ